MTGKIRIGVLALLLVVGIAFSVHAGEKIGGKVVKIDGGKVTVMLDGPQPEWIKSGANVTVGGAAPKVLSIKANEIVLRFSKAKASKLKVDSAVVIEEAAGDELQGC